MVGIANILGVQFPIVRQGFGEAADHLQLAACRDGKEAGDVRADIVFEGRCFARKRSENQAVTRGHAQFARSVLFGAEVGCHAAVTVHAALERDGAERAIQVITPRMIDTGEVLGAGAAIVEADQGTAVNAAVLERGDIAGWQPDDDNGHTAHEGRAPITCIRDIHLKAQEIPALPLKQPLLLLIQDGGILIRPERDAREALRPEARGCETGDCIGHATALPAAYRSPILFGPQPAL